MCERVCVCVCVSACVHVCVKAMSTYRQTQEKISNPKRDEDQFCTSQHALSFN